MDIMDVNMEPKGKCQACGREALLVAYNMEGGICSRCYHGGNSNNWFGRMLIVIKELWAMRNHFIIVKAKVKKAEENLSSTLSHASEIVSESRWNGHTHSWSEGDKFTCGGLVSSYLLMRVLRHKYRHESDTEIYLMLYQDVAFIDTIFKEPGASKEDCR